MKKIILIMFFFVFSSISMASSYLSVGFSKTNQGGDLGQAFHDLQATTIQSFVDSGFGGGVSVRGEHGASISLGSSTTDGLGWQISYIDAGGLTLHSFGSTSGGGIEVDVSFDITTFEFALTYNYSLTDNLSLYGLAGLHFWDIDYVLSESAYAWAENLPFTDDAESESGTHVTYGFGASYKINEGISAGLQWQSFSLDGDDMINLSAKLNFHF